MNGPHEPLETSDYELEVLDRAERAILGSMLADLACALDAPRMVRAEDLSTQPLALAFRAVQALTAKGQRPDLVTVAAELQAREDLARAGGLSALAALLDYQTGRENLADYARLVAAAARRRRAVALAQAIAADPAQANGKLEELRAALEPAPESGWCDKAVSAALLSRMEIPDPVSLLGQGLLSPGDFGLFYGQPKIGKSWLLCMLALSWARAEPWLGLAGPERPLNVGLVTLELTAKRVQQRLRQIGGPQPENLHVLTRTDLGPVIDILSADTRAQLAGLCRGRSLDVLALDPLNRLHKADPNDSQVGAELMAAIHGLAFDTGSCVFLTAHERKRAPGAKGDDDDISALANSGRFSSDPNLLIRVVRRGGLLQVRCVGANNGQPFDPIHVQPSRGDGPAIVVPDPSQVAQANAEKVRAVLADGYWHQRGEIEHATGLSGKTVMRHLRDMQGLETSGSTSDRRYRLGTRDNDVQDLSRAELNI